MYSKGCASVPDHVCRKRQVRDQNHIKISFSNTQAQTGMASRFYPPTLQVRDEPGEGSGVEPEIAVPKPVFPLSPEVTGRRIRPRQVSYANHLGDRFKLNGNLGF